LKNASRQGGEAAEQPAENTAMTIELKPEQERTIDLGIRSGVYHDSGEVLDQAFEIIRAQLHSEDWLAKQSEAVAAQIATGFAQAERGELMDGEAAVEMLHQRRAARLKMRE
jgi:Arc/MetJ-type ribon-helix-helix transcriptional regulator